jgi:hypothetical protein
MVFLRYSGMIVCASTRAFLSLRYDIGPHRHDCHVSIYREMPTKEKPETLETHVEKRLKWLLARIGETPKRLEHARQCGLFGCI